MAGLEEFKEKTIMKRENEEPIKLIWENKSSLTLIFYDPELLLICKVK
jgi:hypothetical protein